MCRKSPIDGSRPCDGVGQVIDFGMVSSQWATEGRQKFCACARRRAGGPLTLDRIVRTAPERGEPGRAALGAGANDVGPRANGAGPRANDAGLRANDAGLRANDVGFRANGAGSRANDAGLRANDAGLRANGAGLRANDARFRAKAAGRRRDSAATSLIPTTAAPGPAVIHRASRTVVPGSAAIDPVLRTAASRRTLEIA